VKPNACNAPQPPPDPPKQEAGIVCPKCGNRRLPTVFTRHRRSAVVRVRRCKNPKCRHRIRTVEKVESNAS
jgi:DNA-directed RNA polymerase subunit RPC12/RpoP